MNKIYKISKTINNNVAFSTDENGRELVVTGKGIAFGKHIGDTIDGRDITKTFALVGEEQYSMFNELISNIPNQYLITVSKIVNIFEEKMGITLNSMIYIALTDHLASAIERKKEGIVFYTGLNTQIKRLYPQEFELAVESLNIIEKDIGIKLDEEEVSFIVMHILNASEKNYRTDAMIRITFVNEVLKIVENFFNTKLDENSLPYYRFVTHLNFFANRLFGKDNIDSDDDFIYYLAKYKYHKEAKCVDKIAKLIKEKYKKNISDEEKGYLLIHIKNLHNNLRL